MDRRIETDLKMTFVAAPAETETAQPPAPLPASAPRPVIGPPGPPASADALASASPPANPITAITPTSPTSPDAPALVPALATSQPPVVPVPVVVKPMLPTVPPEYAHLADLDRASLYDLLKPEQRAVMGHLVRGNVPSQAAKAANVDRSTVYRWQKQPLFAAVFLLLQDLSLQDARVSIRMLATQIVHVIKSGLDEGNVKLAMDAAKMLKLFERQEE
jgi:hypothetical protein